MTILFGIIVITLMVCVFVAGDTHGRRVEQKAIAVILHGVTVLKTDEQRFMTAYNRMRARVIHLL